MKHIEKNVILHAPLRVVYNQWTQFEQFPLFMPAVLSVQQLDNRHVFWRVDIWGREMGWVAEIHEQVPDRSIAWRTIQGRFLSGRVTFQEVDDHSTSVTVAVDYQVNGPLEWVCDALGAVRSQLDASLRLFRDFIETRHQPTGGWRGEIHEMASAGRAPTKLMNC